MTTIRNTERTAGSRCVVDVERYGLERLRLTQVGVATLAVSGRDRKQLLQQLALRQTIDARNLKPKLSVQRKAIQKTWHPGTRRHFVASRAAERDARAIRRLEQRERERERSSKEREL